MIHPSRDHTAFGRQTSNALIGVAAVAASLLATAVQLRAQGTLTNIYGAGDASVQMSGAGAASGVISPSGVEVLLTTENSNPTHDGGNVSGIDAIPEQNLSNFLYLDPASVQSSTGNPGTEGSAFEFAVTTTGPTAFTIETNFVTAEDVGQSDANPDFSLETVTPVDSNGFALGATSVTPLGGVADGAASFSVIPDVAGTSPFSFQEGFKTTTVYLNGAGDFIVGFGVADANTFDTQSGLFLDGAILLTPVPEPGTFATLLFAAGAGLAWMAVRRSRVSARA